MKRIAWFLLSPFLIGVLAVSAWADPIAITSGSLNMPNSLGGSVTLAGDRGFTLTAGTGTTQGFYGPVVTCQPCEPGDTINLAALWSGSGLGGPATATLDGRFFSSVRGDVPRPDVAFAEISFHGDTIAPPLAGTTATLIAPFTFSGRFLYPALGESTLSVSDQLIGQGIVTLTLARPEGSPVWSHRSGVYEFQAADPVPEPGTMLLLATGLGFGAARLKRLRR